MIAPVGPLSFRSSNSATHLSPDVSFLKQLASSIFLLIALTLLNSPLAVAQTPVTNGYKDFSFGTSGITATTGEKPESKLWYTPDGIWWGNFYNDPARQYHIYRFVPSTQSWVDTGTAVDNRTSSKSDALWDGQKLYIVSHIFTTNAVATSSNWGRLYRYSYNSTNRTYTLDSGFPVTNVTRGKSETLTIAKDSTGKLWVTYVEGGKPMVNRTTGSDAQWGTPFVMPGDTTTTTVTTDDISSIIAFGGDKVGIMWSNQNTSRFYFSVHADGGSDTAWTQEIPITGPTGLSDDHINLKTTSDGRVFAAVKTSFTASADPLIKLLVRGAGGGWTDYNFGRKTDHHTRPIVVLDPPSSTLYVFATSPESGGAIYYKSSNINNISFPVGLGTPFIRNTSENNINDATSSKQNVTSSSGLLVAATNNTVRAYYHNSFGLGSSSGAPTITSFTPTSGSAGDQVTITGTNFTGTTAVSFNGTNTATFNIASDTQLTASVPLGATSGKIAVTNAAGTGTSSSDFSIASAPPTITSFTPASGPVGTAVTITGTNFTNSSAVKFNGTTATFTVTNATTIQTTVPGGAQTGKISVTAPGGTASSANDFTVTTTPPGTQTFTLNPTADTYVRGGTYSSTNFGASTLLNARTSTVPDNYRDAYLKYDLGTISSVTSAKIQFLSRLGTTASVLTEVRSVADTSWAEAGMTYDTRPALGTVLGTVTVSGSTYVWYEVDVTSYVQSEKAAGRNTVSVALHDSVDSGTYRIIYAKEWSAANAAKLVVVGN
ncbi:MAG TPA: IPT/TIG domain-containing protein [Clostridia bacterium]|nr:IPT/TIG domain-containing protein [Clostridia bacterium]